MLSDKTMRALEQGIAEVITSASPNYEELADQQRRIFGRAYAKLNEVAFLSHEVFWNLGRGEVVAAQEQYIFCAEAYEELAQIVEPSDGSGPGIPGIYGKELLNNAGQELVEAAVGIRLYPVLIGEQEPEEISLPSEEDLDVTRQAWLAGVSDASSEMSKITKPIYVYQIKRGRLKISKEDLFERALAIGQGIQISLKRLGMSYPKVLNATTRFGQGYSSKRRLVSGSIFFLEKDITDLDEVGVEALELAEE